MGDPVAPYAVVLFDGICNLCNGFVQFVIRRDPRRHFRFASLGSETALKLMSQVGAPPAADETIVLIEDGRVYTRSAAVLRIASRLRFPWPLLYGFIVVPRGLRDWVYAVIAANRRRWFGERDRCAVPGPETRDRFLIDTPEPSPLR